VSELEREIEMVIRQVISDQRNLPNSGFKQGNFRLGELNP